MDEETLKAIAGQLRQPKGEYAIQVGEKMNEGNLHINLYTIEALRLATNNNILEIGMGNGFFVKDIFINDNTITYTGCDFSEIMVDQACKLNDQFIKNEQVNFLVANAEKLPFDQEIFDKVFSVNTIYFWDNPVLVLLEIHRVLKPDGQITISIRPKSVMEHYPFVKFGFAMFTKDDLIKLLIGNNFKVIDILEKVEPEQEINGEKMTVETLLISAVKQ
ncbi:MAG: class I SAM-dependent methyltransferase [Chitinophagaceae bacterium]